MATIHTQSAYSTPKPFPVVASELADDGLAIHPSRHKPEVVIFLQNRLISERRALESERDHLAHNSGRLFDLTAVHIALLENDITRTEKLLQEVAS